MYNGIFTSIRTPVPGGGPGSRCLKYHSSPDETTAGDGVTERFFLIFFFLLAAEEFAISLKFWIPS